MGVRGVLHAQDYPPPLSREDRYSVLGQNAINLKEPRKTLFFLKLMVSIKYFLSNVCVCFVRPIVRQNKRKILYKTLQFFREFFLSKTFPINGGVVRSINVLPHNSVVSQSVSPLYHQMGTNEGRLRAILSLS